LTTLIYGFGTLIFVYSRIFLSHAVSAFFGFLCFYLIFKMKYDKKSKDYSFLAGLAGGLAILSDYVMFLVFTLSLLLITIYLRDWKKSLRFVIAGFIFILIILVHNHVITGSPVDFPYFHMDSEFWNKGVGVSQQFNTSLSDSPYVFIRLLFFLYRGLLFYSPILIFSVIGLFFMYKKHKFETIFISVMSLLFLVYNSLMHTWWGGYCFGPRHLTPLVPFLMIPLLFAMKKIKLCYIMPFIVISIFFNLLSLQIPEEAGLGKVVNNFVPFGNPLFEHYLSLFLSQGPRSILLERILGFQFKPFFNVVLVLIPTYFIWRRT